MTSDPNDPDTGGRAVPPYDGRRTSADVGGPDETRRDGANVGGATGPVEDDEFTSPNPRQTPGGATATPADEQPAAAAPGTGSDDGTGPAHQAGTPRAEDQG
jgi:hypothetical protein